MNYKILLLLVHMLLVAFCRADVDEKSKFTILRCKAEYVAIRGITPVSLTGLYDDKGKSVDWLGTGMAELYVTDGVVSGNDSVLSLIEEKLSNVKSWKKVAPKPQNEAIVGLDMESTDYIVHAKNKWILVRLFSTSLMCVDAELIIDRGSVKIFTKSKPQHPVYYDDSEIIRYFGEFKMNEGKKNKPNP